MYDLIKLSRLALVPAVAGFVAISGLAGTALAAERVAYEQLAAADVWDVMQANFGGVGDIHADVPKTAPITAGDQVAEAGPEAIEPAAGPSGSEQIAQAADNGINDPLEDVNRAILEFNEFVQALILRPVAEIYVLMIPDVARDAIQAALDNLRSPVVLANDLLQGEMDRAWDTTQRMVINSTVGVGGLVDVADKWGIKKHSEDLGQTFAVWGVGEGFYLVLPFLGPSNPRDAVGKFLDSFLDPLSHYADNTNREEISYTRTFLGGVDEFSRVMDDLQKLKETSVDYYAALRSVARQKREADIRNGTPLEGAPVPDLKYDFNAQFTNQ